MAAYYGWIKGSSNGPAPHRLGGKIGGVLAGVQSWSHVLTTRMCERDEQDFIRLELTDKHGRELATFQGTPADLAKKLRRK